MQLEHARFFIVDNACMVLLNADTAKHDLGLGLAIVTSDVNLTATFLSVLKTVKQAVVYFTGQLQVLVQIGQVRRAHVREALQLLLLKAFLLVQLALL